MARGVTARLLVDAQAFLYHMLTQTRVGFGGYEALIACLCRWLDDLQLLGARLEFFFEGPHAAAKRATQLERRSLDAAAIATSCARHLSNTTSHVAASADQGSVLLEALVPPLVAKEVMLRVLSERGVPCFQAAGEADSLINRMFQRDPENAYVISNDSDFFVYDVRFVPLDGFRVIRYGGQVDIAMNVYENAATAASLGLKQKHLPVFSCLAGNDYSKSFVSLHFDRMISKAGVRGKRSAHQVIESAVVLCSRLEHEDDWPLMLKQVLRFTDHEISLFRESLRVLQEGCVSIDDGLPAEGPYKAFPPLMLQAFLKCQVDSVVVGAIVHGEWWGRVTHLGDYPDVYLIARPLRKRLYRLLGLPRVCEYFQLGSKFVQDVVCIVPEAGTEKAEASSSVIASPPGLSHFWDPLLSSAADHASRFDSVVQGLFCLSPADVAALKTFPKEEVLGLLSLKLLMQANESRGFLFQWEPFVLMAHFSLCVHDGSFISLMKKGAHARSAVSDKPKLRRLLIRIPALRTLTVSSTYQVMLLHVWQILQVCNATECVGGAFSVNFRGERWNDLYHKFYEHVLSRKYGTRGPWIDRPNSMVLANDFCLQILHDGPEKETFVRVRDFVFGASLHERYKNFRRHFPDEFRISAMKAAQLEAEGEEDEASHPFFENAKKKAAAARDKKKKKKKGGQMKQQQQHQAARPKATGMENGYSNPFAPLELLNGEVWEEEE